MLAVPMMSKPTYICALIVERVELFSEYMFDMTIWSKPISKVMYRIFTIKHFWLKDQTIYCTEISMLQAYNAF